MMFIIYLNVKFATINVLQILVKQKIQQPVQNVQEMVQDKMPLPVNVLHNTMKIPI